MMPGIWRKLRADLKTNRLQFSLIGAVLALSAMLLTLSLLVMRSADEPWERTFEQTNGPHVWITSVDPELDFSAIENHAQVSSTTSVILALAESPLIIGDIKVPAFIYAMDQPPAVAHPLLAEGRWLDPTQPDQVVLDYSLARYYDLQVGDVVEVLGNPDVLSLEVVGLAVTAHWFPYDDITKELAPAVAYVSRASLAEIQPDQDFWYSAMGVRLHDPQLSREFVDEIYQLYPLELQSVIEWQFLQENATFANTLNVMFMGLFSGMGLIAVGLIIFNTIGGQILSQYRDIGLMKSIGLTPWQITSLFLIEHLVIGLAASLSGIAAGLLLAPGLISPLAENLNTIPPNVFDPGLMLVVLSAVEIAVLISTLLPAWRGGKVNTIQAITTGYRRRHARTSIVARFASWLHFPAVIVLGVKDTFSRPLRANMAILGLAMTSTIAIMAVQANSTGNDLSHNKVYFNGSSAQVRIERNFIPDEVIQTEILGAPQVEQSYSELGLFGLSPDQTDQPIFFRFLGDGYQDFDFQLKEGRMFETPGEAIVVYGVLDTIGAEIGDTVDLVVDGAPIQLTIVGRYIEGFNTGHVIITSMDTYLQQIDPVGVPRVYYLDLKEGTPLTSVVSDWQNRFEGLVDVEAVSEEPQASLIQFVSLITSLGLIMTLVTSANLISTTVLSIRERVRDFGIQKSLGVTPAQIAGGVVVGTILIAILGFIAGSVVGIGLMDEFIANVGIQLGIGTDFYELDWTWISGLVPAMVLLAILSSLWPALRASRLEVVEALRYE